jgi:hypothetical protein
MAKRLSEQLSDLSVRAKNAEDAAAAAQKEAQEKVAARRAEARAAATAAVEKVKQSIKSVADTGTTQWAAVQAKVAADLDALKAHVAQRKQERDVLRAENQAERLEQDAEFSIDYAIASIEQAKLAVLDAIVGRLDAEAAKAA